MPVNMDPAKKRKRQAPPQEADAPQSAQKTTDPSQTAQFGEETEEDKVKALAEAEQTNLWDATEVIDMDKF